MKYFCLVVLTLSTLASSSFSQVPDFSKVHFLHDGDSTNITLLIKNGIKVSDRKVICWFPKDSLSKTKMNEITGMLNKGITAAEKFIGAPLAWQVHQPNEPYTFYFRPDRFVSHASGAGFISIPFWRIKEEKSPWLHEVLHEILYATSEDSVFRYSPQKENDENIPLWLYEGLPDYIALKVSMAENIKWFDVFSNSYQQDFNDIDSLFVEGLTSEKAKYVLTFIGKKGELPELSSGDRFLYAPAFYHGACSFVNYLAASYGLPVLLSSIAAFAHEQEIIEKYTGKSIGTLKKEWLDKLNIVE